MGERQCRPQNSGTGMARGKDATHTPGADTGRPPRHSVVSETPGVTPDAWGHLSSTHGRTCTQHCQKRQRAVGQGAGDGETATSQFTSFSSASLSTSPRASSILIITFLKRGPGTRLPPASIACGKRHERGTGFSDKIKSHLGLSRLSPRSSVQKGPVLVQREGFCGWAL